MNLTFSLLKNRPLTLRKRHKVLLIRDVFPLAWPIFIELLCVVLMGIISTILVSRLGQSQTAAIGISDSFTYIIYSVLAAIELGGTVIVAQSYGRRNSEQALDQARQTITLNALISVLFCIVVLLGGKSLLEVVAYGAEPDVIHLAEVYLTAMALSYPALAITLAGNGVLRAVGNSRLPMRVNILTNLLNIVFSYPLIYGVGDWQGLGLLGAGLGVSLARWVGAFIILAYLAKNSRFVIPFELYFSKFSRKVLADILGIGIPASVESLMFNIGKMITILMVAGMGTVAMAGNVIAFSIILMINIPGNTLGMAATVIVGKRLGQNRPRMAQQELVLILVTSTILLVCSTLLLVPFIHYIALLYTTEESVIDVVVNLFYMNAIMMPVWAASFVLPAAFKGAKDVKFTMWTAILSMWGFRICCGYVFGVVLDFGVYGVWVGMFSDWIVRGTLFTLRLFNQKWLARYFRDVSR
ncbi:EmmdR/YeeO family multidrug/toxin efflux MATE transporter [Vibrio algivorus]|uniref:Multidrug resistance protein NorM n=1 Tax=Vibrio algivorus TaxID=1667024 RepID=A0A557PFC0_9VIBR|nr:EmmdR/YeeO family multidrug/toxin efflux MATE transporter [Vibrio algivorus]TVO39336.1 EmmdR/YeeO family multidrug/toxin efflux MATE transporter [Vibrio algivorus]